MPSALIYTTLKNHLTDKRDLVDFNNKNIKWVNYAQGNEKNLVGQDDVKRKILDRILDQTTIKRACCNKLDSIDVRIPPPNKVKDIKGNIVPYDVNKETNAAMYKKFEYHDVKGLTVPKNMCPNGHYGAGKMCDDFYTVYCGNILKMYLDQVKKITGKNAYDHDEFSKYKPECACYGYEKSVQELLRQGISRKCVFPHCARSGDKSYHHPSTRGQKCSINVCQNIVNMQGAEAGAGISVNIQSSVACGGALSPADRRRFQKEQAEKKQTKIKEEAEKEKALKQERKRQKQLVEEAKRNEAERKRLETIKVAQQKKKEQDRVATLEKNKLLVEQKKLKEAQLKAQKAKKLAEKQQLEAEEQKNELTRQKAQQAAKNAEEAEQKLKIQKE